MNTNQTRHFRDTMKRRPSFGIVICLLMCALVTSLQSDQEKSVYAGEFKIGAKDLLEIKVFELPELNQTVRVSEDGTITLPLIGSVAVEGLSKDEVEQEISSLLEKKYVKKARVSVFITEYKSKQVAVIGAVNEPGTYDLIGDQKLLQIISEAGGFTENVSDKLFILRENQNGQPERFSIDLKDLLLNGNKLLNIPLKANDVINVPVDEIVQVYVFGAVGSPGALETKKSKKITLLQAIAQAGGLAEGASKGGIVIKRKDQKTGRETQVKVNLNDILKGKKPDIYLQEGDVVYVPEKLF